MTSTFQRKFTIFFTNRVQRTRVVQLQIIERAHKESGSYTQARKKIIENYSCTNSTLISVYFDDRNERRFKNAVNDFVSSCAHFVSDTTGFFCSGTVRDDNELFTRRVRKRSLHVRNLRKTHTSRVAY